MKRFILPLLALLASVGIARAEYVSVGPAGGATATGIVTACGATNGQILFDSAGSCAGAGQGTLITGNGALSSGAGPALSLTGTWVTGGSATTTKPLMLIEPSGTTSTGWSTNGTGLGVNAASGFTGSLIDEQVSGTSRLKSSFDGTDATLTLNGSGQTVISSAQGFLQSNQGFPKILGANFSFATIASPGTSWLFVTPGSPPQLQLQTSSATLTSILTSAAAANWQLGDVAANPPVAQKLSVQNASGSNIAGANTTFIGSLSTGSGTSGDIIFQTGGTGAGASSLNTATTAVTIKGATQNANFVGIIATSNTTDATSTSTGAITNTGGMSVNKRVFMNGLTASASVQSGIVCLSSGSELINESVACLASSREYKDEIGPLEDGALAKIASLPLYRWRYKRTNSETPMFNSADWLRERIGPYAEDVKAMDDRVGTRDRYSTEELLALVIKAVQELKARTDQMGR